MYKSKSFVASIMALQLGALCVMAQTPLISQGAAPAPEKVEAIQVLQKQAPIYAAENAGVWANEVGGPLREGAKEFGIQGGYGTSFYLGGTKHSYKYGWALPRFGYVFTDMIGEDVLGGIFKGNGEVIIEGLFGIGIDGRPEGSTEGLSAMYKHNFITGTRFVPFVELGLGLSMNSFGIHECQTDFEFIDQVGAGCQYFLNDSWALMVEARFHHMSNAGLSSSNPGLNNVILSTGVTHFF